MVCEEDAYYFTSTSIAAQANADICEHYSTAKVGKNPGGAAILFMHSVLIRDSPDVLAKVLHIAELDMGRILHVHFHHTIQQ
jgi:hypothetical protein